jgi:K+-sensing histidine kinase KdpD
MSTDAKLLEIFLASSIHEAKNHLGHLGNTVDNISTEASGISATQLAQAKSQLHSLSHLLNQVLVHYRGVHQGYQLHMDEVDLEDFFDDFHTRQSPNLTAKAAQLVSTVETQESAFFDEQLIANVLDTLVANALSAGATTLKLSAKQGANQQTCIELIDNGPGLPEYLLTQDLETLQPIQANEHKTGLGLYLANQILKAHQNQGQAGELHLQNRRDESGACVTLLLP